MPAKFFLFHFYFCAVVYYILRKLKEHMHVLLRPHLICRIPANYAQNKMLFYTIT